MVVTPHAIFSRINSHMLLSCNYHMMVGLPIRLPYRDWPFSNHHYKSAIELMGKANKNGLSRSN